MGKTKSITDDGERLVKRKELDTVLARFARLADAAMAAKLAGMKAEIVEELRAELATESQGT